MCLFMFSVSPPYVLSLLPPPLTIPASQVSERIHCILGMMHAVLFDLEINEDGAEVLAQS